MLINKGAKRHIFRWICQVILSKKWGILIKEESESLDFIGLKIPRDYVAVKEEKGKVRKGFYIEEDLLEQMEGLLEQADVKSRNEFLNQALKECRLSLKKILQLLFVDLKKRRPKIKTILLNSYYILSFSLK